MYSINYVLKKYDEKSIEDVERIIYETVLNMLLDKESIAKDYIDLGRLITGEVTIEDMKTTLEEYLSKLSNITFSRFYTVNSVNVKIDREDEKIFVYIDVVIRGKVSRKEVVDKEKRFTITLSVPKL